MPTITFDSRSFLLDNRRLWIVGATLDYARIPAERWRTRVRAARQAGFNTVSTPCPWLVHEPRKGRFTFSGQANVRRFAEICADEGMFLVLRPGPYVGEGYDGGGLPSWLTEIADLAMREPNEAFLERVTIFFRRLFSELNELQVTRDRRGPILLIQAEQSWCCTNPDLSDQYFGELARHIRENGMNVPLVAANDLWAEFPEGVETWSGYDNLLANLRQLRLIQPDAPRVVSRFPVASTNLWGRAPEAEEDEPDFAPMTVLHRFAQILAAGAQPIVAPFHAGTNFDFLGGRTAGEGGGFLGTAVAHEPPLGEAGCRGPKYDAIKRLASFARHFGYVFSDLAPDVQPTTLDLGDFTGRGAPGAGLAVVPVSGGRGQAVFVFAPEQTTGASATLLLENGLSMPVELGEQPVGWYLIDVDLGGTAQLDYSNLCPFALVNRSILVLHGPSGSRGYVSIGGSVAEAPVPEEGEPVVLEHHGITVVVCNREQIDATYEDGTRVFVGIEGFDDGGNPLPRKGFDAYAVIAAGGNVEVHEIEAAQRRSPAIKLDEWSAAPAAPQAEGTSQRYASIEGPATLDQCGAVAGYGWYRVEINSGSTRKRTCVVPESGDRLGLYVNGEFQRVYGEGPGAERGAFDLKLGRGKQTLVGLADHFGRFAEGNDAGRRKGWYGHVYEIKALKTTKGKVIDAPPVDPLEVRGLIIGQSKGKLSDDRHVAWNFTHRKKSPVLVQIEEGAPSGTLIINDELIGYHAGETGAGRTEILLLSEEIESMKRGKNEFRFAPDGRAEDVADEVIKATSFHECVEAVTDGASWAFARWEPPGAKQFQPMSKSAAKDAQGRPCWWRTTFGVASLPWALWFDTTGLSKGQVFLNGRNVGRYFTATHDGSEVGPQTRLYLPEPWIEAEGENELIVFDEHGFSPFRTKILSDPAGDLDE